MIIGVEAQEDSLMISYYDGDGNIAYMRKRLAPHEVFNWEEGDKPSIEKNWDGKYLKKVKSKPQWLSRTRIEELILEKLTPQELETIYSFDNYPKISYTDIEIKLTDTTFPYPERAAMPVGMVSFCTEEGISYVLSIMDSEEHPDGLSREEIDKMEKEVCKYFTDIVPLKEKDAALFNVDFKIKYKHFNSEKELMEFYFHQIVPKQALITGWNFIDFDWQYLMNRCKNIGVDPLDKMSSRKTFSKRYKQPTHLGIVDYMAFMQDPGYKPYKVVENYTLDYISQRTLNTTKLKHPYKNMLEFQQDVYMFTMYNVIDNLLVKLIEDKLGILEVAFAFANTAQIELNKIFSPVHITEVLMSRELLKNNKHMMKKPYSSDEVEDTKYAGAWVMPPIPGYYKYISCYDFKSMYPNIAMQYNTSPDSYLGKRGMVKEDGTEIITKNNTLFSSKFDSVTRIILERLYNARIDAQAEISELKYG
jgi:DNA polymerase elongation subunit (family B)